MTFPSYFGAGALQTFDTTHTALGVSSDTFTVTDAWLPTSCPVGARLVLVHRWRRPNVGSYTLTNPAGWTTEHPLQTTAVITNYMVEMNVASVRLLPSTLPATVTFETNGPGVTTIAHRFQIFAYSHGATFDTARIREGVGVPNQAVIPTWQAAPVSNEPADGVLIALVSTDWIMSITGVNTANGYTSHPTGDAYLVIADKPFTAGGNEASPTWDKDTASNSDSMGVRICLNGQDAPLWRPRSTIF